jgi:hypothetical protein
LALPIKDPILDFLNLPIAGHYSDASEVVTLYRVCCDLSGDGTQVTFIGHHQMWNGGNSIYYSAYHATQGNINRLLSSTEDVAINFRDGNRETCFIGYIKEMKVQGLLILDPIYHHKRGDISELLPIEEYSSRNVYYIQDGKLKTKDLGPMNIKSIKGRRFFDQYFSENVYSRPISNETFSTDKLIELGYQLPDWKREKNKR